MLDRYLNFAFVCLAVAHLGCSDGGTTAGTSTGDTSASGGTGGAGTTSVTSTGPGGPGGAAMSSSSSASSSSGGSIATLGLPCAVDSDCGPASRCLASTANITALGGGGPAGGYCSSDCATNSDCPAPGGVCLGASAMSVGICVLACDLGPSLMTYNAPLDPEKCHGREDVRCAAIDANGTSVCLPTCGRDDQCAPGRVCDPYTITCVDVAHSGLPMGASCDPMAQMPECAGRCVTFSGGTTSCSSPCVLGGDFTDLAAVADCGGLDKGVCTYAATGYGAGDVGYCAEVCTAHDDCQNPSFWCVNIGFPKGSCFGAKACPNGQVACSNQKTCTATKYGPFCLDPTYPLGAAAP